MVTRNAPWPAGTPCWVDLGVDDVDRGAAFYSAVFGWRVDEGPPEAGGYRMCTKNGLVVAGLGAKQSPDQPSVWTTYLATEDADETVRKINAAGGKVLVEAIDVMNVGRMAIAADTDGAVFGIWQSRAHTGMQLANEPGSVTWNENMSRDFDGNKAFYQAVFGYDYDDMSGGGFTYATFKVGGESRGGLGELGKDTPMNVPANWTTYFSVADTDATVAKASELGGNVLSPAEDTEFGRMAILTDDQGSIFAVVDQSAMDTDQS